MHCTVHCTVEPLHDNQFPNNAHQPAAARTAAPGFPALARQLSTEQGHTFTKLSALTVARGAETIMANIK